MVPYWGYFIHWWMFRNIYCGNFFFQGSSISSFWFRKHACRACHFLQLWAALEMCGLQPLYERREERCLDFALKCCKHPKNSRIFPLNPRKEGGVLRAEEKFMVNFARTEAYRKSTIPYCQRLLNQYFKLK